MKFLKNNPVGRVLQALVTLIFYPLSPCMILLVGWILTLIVTDANESFPKPIYWCLIHRQVLIFVLAIWFIIAFLIQYTSSRINDYKTKVSSLEEEIKEQKRLLNTSSGIILNKFGEFGRFKRIAMFEEAMKTIVDNSSMIDSAQLYQYSVLSEGKKYTVIKLNSVSGYAQEGVVINSILQTYYKLKKDDYNRFKDVLSIWKQLIFSNRNNMSWNERERKNAIFADESMELFSDLKNVLNHISSTDLHEDDGEIYYNTYRMLTVLYQLMNPSDDINRLPSLLSKTDGVESELHNGKRTGILGSILIEDSFMFRNTGISSKNGRLYIAFTVEIFEQNYCILFTVGATQMEYIRSKQQLKEECERLKKRFVEIIQKIST